MEFKYGQLILSIGVILLMCWTFLLGVNAVMSEYENNDYISFRCENNEKYDTKECSCYTNSLDFHAVNYCDLWLKESRTVVFE